MRSTYVEISYKKEPMNQFSAFQNDEIFSDVTAEAKKQAGENNEPIESE